jgi:hypothetical protein
MIELVLTGLEIFTLNFFVTNVCYKTSYLNKEVNCTDTSHQLSLPWPYLF